MKEAIAIIPARSGSRRIKSKNIRNFHGNPIIAYSIKAALRAEIFEEVLVSTDEETIGHIAVAHGATWHRRPVQLAEDSVGTQEVTREAILFQIALGGISDWPKYACCIYPCAPMLDAGVLRQAFDLLIEKNADYVVPVATWLRDPAQFYFGRSQAFIDKAPLIGPNTIMHWIDPATECDINIEQDWLMAEKMFALRAAR